MKTPIFAANIWTIYILNTETGAQTVIWCEVTDGVHAGERLDVKNRLPAYDKWCLCGCRCACTHGLGMRADRHIQRPRAPSVESYISRSSTDGDRKAGLAQSISIWLFRHSVSSSTPGQIPPSFQHTASSSVMWRPQPREVPGPPWSLVYLFYGRDQWGNGGEKGVLGYGLNSISSSIPFRRWQTLASIKGNY